MRFGLIDGTRAEFPVHRLCRVLGVSLSARSEAIFVLASGNQAL
jgi:hypothetical protein